MSDLKSSRCPACSAALWADAKKALGKLTCPRCSAELFFINTGDAPLFVVRASTHPVAELLRNRPLEMDSLEAVELVFEIMKEN